MDTPTERAPEKAHAFNPAEAVFTPAEAAAYALQTTHEVRRGSLRGLEIGLPRISPDYVPRVLPGQTAVILAQTSHYKSGLMHFIERRGAEQLVLDGREDEVIVHVSVEETVEEQVYQHLAYRTGVSAGEIARGDVQDWSALEDAVTWVGQVPIYRIGESLARPEATPLLHLSNMLKCIEYLRDRLFDKPLKIAALFFDYLQAFPLDPGVMAASIEQRRNLQVREDFYRLRAASRFFACPVFVAVQAKQKLEGAPGPNMLIPGIYDAQETSSIAQRADRVFSLWLPKQTHQVGTTITHKNFEFHVDENLAFFKVAKQRGGLPAGRMWPLRIDYTRNKIATLDLSQLATPEQLLEFV